MGIIDKIRKKVINKEYEFAIPHFFEEMSADKLEFADVKRAIATGRIRWKFIRTPEVYDMKLWVKLWMEERLVSFVESKVRTNYFLSRYMLYNIL